MTQLNNAVILLTGATGGFGKELTSQLLKAGSQLILSDINQAGLEKYAAAVSQEITTGKIIACIESNLASQEGCQSLFAKVQALNIPVDILINNAGIGLFGRMDEVPVDKWERLMQINLMAPMRLSSLFMAGMIDRRKGHIVNISSIAGWVAPAGMAHYSCSKFGLRGFSEGLFNEVKQYNVKVTAVYPFFSKTPILQSEGFGTLAEGGNGFPEDKATDPAKVMAATIKAIANNKLHVFPDRMANSIHLVKQYIPKLFDFMRDRYKAS